MTLPGFHLLRGYLDRHGQSALLGEVLELVGEAPFYRPVVPSGGRMSVAMTNFGSLGWVTDRSGYRYETNHPVTGRPWPAIPPRLLELWKALGGERAPADACLVNRYDAKARMGLHRDADEADFGFPVVSISLGDAAVFRLGGLRRSDSTVRFDLASGDVCVLAGPARLAYHGVDRVLAGTSDLIAGGGRINLTLRRAAATL